MSHPVLTSGRDRVGVIKVYSSFEWWIGAKSSMHLEPHQHKVRYAFGKSDWCNILKEFYAHKRMAIGWRQWSISARRDDHNQRRTQVAFRWAKKCEEWANYCNRSDIWERQASRIWRDMSAMKANVGVSCLGDYIRLRNGKQKGDLMDRRASRGKGVLWEYPFEYSSGQSSVCVEN